MKKINGHSFLRLDLPLLAFVVLVSGCTSRNLLHDSVFDIQLGSIAEYHGLAADHAYNWRHDAYLASFTLTVLFEEGDNLLVYSYEFRSPADPGNWYLIKFSNDFPDEETIEFTGNFPEGTSRLLPKEIDLSAIVFDLEEVLTIALDNGGRNFITEQRGYESIIIDLAQENTHAATGNVRWVVVLISQSEKYLRLEINPMTGLIIE